MKLINNVLQQFGLISKPRRRKKPRKITKAQWNKQVAPRLKSARKQSFSKGVILGKSMKK